jgi:hypothetical protein
MLITWWCTEKPGFSKMDQAAMIPGGRLAYSGLLSINGEQRCLL